jgi:predicted nucleic acid-binding protein
LTAFGKAPLTLHELPARVVGAWTRSSGLRVADAVYVELAHQLSTRVVPVDARLAHASTYAVLPPGFNG